MKSGLGMIACALALSATPALADARYVKIADGPTYEVARAKCEMDAMGLERQINARGSLGFVLAAEIGNAIGNAVRMSQYTERCMVVHGWRKTRADDAQQTAARPARAYRTISASQLAVVDRPEAPIETASSEVAPRSIYATTSPYSATSAAEPRPARRGTVQTVVADRPGRKLPFRYMQD